MTEAEAAALIARERLDVVRSWELFCRELAKEIVAARMSVPAEEVLVQVADTMREVSKYPALPPSLREVMN